MADLSGVLASLKQGVGSILQRTYLLQTATPDGIPRLLVVMDTVNEEDPEYTADVTQHAVEQGPEVSDHIQLKNPTLTLKGKISNTPLDLSGAVANLLASGISTITSAQARSNILNTGLPQAAAIGGAALQGNAGDIASSGLAGAADAIARTALLAAYQGKLPFDVITRRQRYPGMVIQRLRFPRNNATGYALDVEIDMIALRVVSPLQVQLTQLDESVISTGTPSSDLGGQTTRQVSDQAAGSINGSWLRQGINFFKGGG